MSVVFTVELFPFWMIDWFYSDDLMEVNSRPIVDAVNQLKEYAEDMIA